MATQQNPFDVIRQHRLVPVIAIRDADSAVDLANALIDGGLPVIEVTMRTEAAPSAMSKIAAKSPITLVAGTVVTPEQVDVAVDSGATLIVSPGINTRVVEHCLKRNVPVLPGVCTPTEVETARNYGLKHLKFFPAEAYGGARTLKALGDVYGTFSFMPTGGINLQNLNDYLRLPIVMGCGGSWMAPGDLITKRNFEGIVQLVQDAVVAVSGMKSAPLSIAP